MVILAIGAFHMPGGQSLRRKIKRAWLSASVCLGVAVGTISATAESGKPFEDALRLITWICAKSYERVLENVHGLATSPFLLTDRFFLGYVLSFVAFGAIAYSLNYPSPSRPSFRGFISFLFPANVYGHRSARVDYAIFLLNRIFTPAVLVTRLWTSVGIATAVGLALTAAFGPSEFQGELGLWHVVLYTALSVLAYDFADYAIHALLHRIPFLWEFHKLHHSAEVMTPFTVTRVHPIEQIAGAVIATPIAGTVSGIAAYVFLREPSPLLLVGAPAVQVLFFAGGYHLRHSHVWLSWGPVLGRILISPAQHQIHHSVAPEHHDRNYGFIFAIWDWMFGTLYLTRKKEDLKYGLSGVPSEASHPTVYAAYLQPFKAAAAVAARPWRARLRVEADDARA